MDVVVLDGLPKKETIIIIIIIVAITLAIIIALAHSINNSNNTSHTNMLIIRKGRAWRQAATTRVLASAVRGNEEGLYIILYINYSIHKLCYI